MSLSPLSFSTLSLSSLTKAQEFVLDWQFEELNINWPYFEQLKDNFFLHLIPKIWDEEKLLINVYQYYYNLYLEEEDEEVVNLTENII